MNSSESSQHGMPIITVGVATHKPYRMPSDSMYLPLHVGAALHPEVCPDMRVMIPERTFLTVMVTIPN